MHISFWSCVYLTNPLLIHRLGIWLFMSEMPYGTLSSSMLWKIFYIMQCAEMDGLEKLSCSLSAEDCIQGLRGETPSTSDADEHKNNTLGCCFSTFLTLCMSRTKSSGEVSVLAVRDKQLRWNLLVDNVCTYGPAQTYRHRPWICQEHSARDLRGDSTFFLNFCWGPLWWIHHLIITSSRCFKCDNFLITLSIKVSYVSITTREIFSKIGRELLAAIATAHPHIISVLLERLRETIEKVGMVSKLQHPSVHQRHKNWAEIDEEQQLSNQH